MKKTILTAALALTVTLANTGVFAETGLTGNPDEPVSVSLTTVAVPVNTIDSMLAGTAIDAELISAPLGNIYKDTAGHWALAEIEKVADKSIFNDGSGSFMPNKNITRMEFAAMIHKALGIQINYFAATDIGEFFSDVKNDDPYASALYDLVTANIIDYKGKFGPAETLPRQDMVHFAVNALEYVTGGDYALIKMMPAPFADADQIKPEYANDFIKAQLLKIVLGNSDSSFAPNRAATRAEAAAVVSRLVDVLKSLKSDNDVKVMALADKSETGLNMELIIANNTDKKITINHRSGQKYDFKLLDQEGNIIYTWSADKLFIDALTETVIEPGESASFSDTIRDEQYEALKDKAATLKAYIVGSSDDFEISSQGYEAVVK